MEKTVLKDKWDSLSKHEKWIMGRPNFTCAAIASLLRSVGFEVAPKAEDEQAAVIFAMLQFHKEYGDNWREKMSDFLAGLTPIPTPTKNMEPKDIENPQAEFDFRHQLRKEQGLCTCVKHYDCECIYENKCSECGLPLRLTDEVTNITIENSDGNDTK